MRQVVEVSIAQIEAAQYLFANVIGPELWADGHHVKSDTLIPLVE